VQALLLSRSSAHEGKQQIFLSTRGILFFCTRHTGRYSDTLPGSIRLFLSLSASVHNCIYGCTLDTTRRLDATQIDRSNAQFNQLKARFRVTCFYDEILVPEATAKVLPTHPNIYILAYYGLFSTFKIVYTAGIRYYKWN
jgi:hypothetical protein